MPLRSLFDHLRIAALLDAIIPPRRSDTIVRGLSEESLARLAASVRRAADAEFAYLLPYRDPGVRALVWELKYRRNPRAAALGGAVCAEEMLGIASEALSRPVVIPVPMHKARRRGRGHNQTETLCASALGRSKGSLAYSPHALERVRRTPPQQGLPRTKRLKNVQGSMHAPAPEIVRGKICIVVDDVATTGATLREARRALRAAGAGAVYCIALAG